MSVSKLLPAVERLGPAAGALIGVAAFFLVANPDILDPTNIAWLGRSDPASFYLSWATYGGAPWALPPGYNPALGLELATSIVFNDAIPLVAITLKPFSSYMSEPFQYFGLWLLACFLLQGFFAWKIGGAIGLPVIARIILTGLLVLAPPFLHRLMGHYALCAQWLVLAALYLYLRPAPKAIAYAWVALLAISCVVQPYLFAMVGAIWVADLVKRRWLNETAWRDLLCEVGLSIGLVTIGLWIAGFFVIESGRAVGGFGVFNVDLLGLIDATGWSRLLAGFPQRIGSSEGFCYLGLGVLLLMAPALPALLAGAAAPLLSRRFAPLLGALAALALFSLTDHVTLAGKPFFTMTLPEWAVAPASTYRTAARMVWPIYYAIVIGVVWLVARSLNARTASLVLTAALLVQIFDTSAGWPKVQSRLVPAGSVWATPLTSPFWDKAAQRYQKVRSLPVQNTGKHWMELGYYALTHGLETDTIYFSRVDTHALRKLQKVGADLLRTHALDHDTLYVVRDPAFGKPLAGDGADAVVAGIDGLWIVAPGAPENAGLQDGIAAAKTALTPPIAKSLSFTTGGHGLKYLGTGWSKPERTGIWSEGPVASLVFHLGAPAKAMRFVFTAKGFPPNRSGAKQRITAAVGDRTLDSFDLDSIGAPEIAFVLPPDLVGNDGYVRIDFHIAKPKSPFELGESADVRQLGVRLIDLTVYDE